MNRLNKHNSLFWVLLLLTLYISLIVPVQWSNTPKRSLCKVINSRLYQRDLGYQQETVSGRKLPQVSFEAFESEKIPENVKYREKRELIA